MAEKNIGFRVTKADRAQIINFEDLLREIKTPEQDGRFTIAEMSKKVGHKPEWCRQRLQELIEEGRVEFAGMVVKKRIDGKACHVGSYRLVGTEEA